MSFHDHLVSLQVILVIFLFVCIGILLGLILEYLFTLGCQKLKAWWRNRPYTRKQLLKAGLTWRSNVNTGRWSSSHENINNFRNDTDPRHQFTD